MGDIFEQKVSSRCHGIEEVSYVLGKALGIIAGSLYHPCEEPFGEQAYVLCEEAKEAFDDKLTKAQASKRIDELQRRTGRGR